MKLYRILKLFTALTFLLFVSCDESNGPDTGNISGKVLDKYSGKAVPNAFISTEPPTESLISDENGEFAISEIPDGSYAVISDCKGYYENRVSVSVYNGRTSSAVIPLLNIMASNNPPEVPHDPLPADGAEMRSLKIIFGWACEDPEGDPITYDIYLDSINPPGKIVGRGIKKKSMVFELVDSTDYYWRIIAKDIYGATNESDVWTFRITSLPSASISTGNLIAYYPMDGNAEDASGNGLHGMESGVFIRKGRNETGNGALGFNGTSANVVLPQPQIFDFPNNFTIACWIKPYIGTGKFLNSVAGIVSKWGNPGQNNSSYQLSITDLGNVFCGTYGQSGTYLTSNSALAGGEWSHIALVYDSGVMKIYINGSLDSQVNAVKPQVSSYNVSIGKYSNDASYFAGDIDDLLIYSKALSTAEILDLFGE